MWDKFKQRYLLPETDDEAQRKAALLVIILRFVMGGAIMLAAIPLFIHSAHLGRDYAITMTMALGAWGLSTLAQRGYVRAASMTWSIMLWGGVSFALWTSGGFYSGAAYGYFLVVIIAMLLLGPWATLFFGVICILSDTSFFLYQWQNGIVELGSFGLTRLHWIFLNVILILATFLLSAAARNITNALKQARDNAQALQESDATLRAYAGRLEIQHEIDQAILAAQSPQAIAQAVLAHLQPLIPNLLSSVIVFDLERQQMQGLVTYARGQRVPKLEITFAGLEGFNIAGLAAGQVQSVPDMSQVPVLSPIHQYFYDGGMRSYINMPLLAQGELVGTLNLGAECPNFFTDTHLEIAHEIAASLAVAMRQAQLHEQVQQDAVVKSRLLQEINHRVGNNLNAIIGLLHIERRFVPEGVGREMIGPTLEHLVQRVSSLAEVHKMLSGNSWTPLNLQELITRLIRQVFNALLTTNKFEINVAPTEVKISSRQANHLALVINELASNTAAHAQTDYGDTRIDVNITLIDGAVEITYRDNGPGYPEAILREERFNVGLYLIQRIVTATLHGRLTLYNDKGAVAGICFEREDLADASSGLPKDEDELRNDV